MRKACFVLATAAIAFGQLAAPAQADAVDANCEVRKDGDKQKGKSGPCTFSQRQGYIDIDLKNGDTLSLRPAGGANQYKDQHHNKVRRTSSGSRSEEFRWEGGKHVIVTFTGSRYSSGNYGNYGSYGNYGNDSHGAGKQNSDYQRGYRDGLAGRYDQYDHTQAYKDGVRDGEAEARYGNGYNSGNHGQHKGGDHGNYTIESIGNGDFEVKWPSHNCFADYDRHGNSTGYTNCSEELKRRSDEIARHRVR